MPEGGVGAYTQGQQMTETAPREGTETPGVFSFKKSYLIFLSCWGSNLEACACWASTL